jgi:hypothetical protein
VSPPPQIHTNKPAVVSSNVTEHPNGSVGRHSSLAQQQKRSICVSYPLEPHHDHRRFPCATWDESHVSTSNQASHGTTCGPVHVGLLKKDRPPKKCGYCLASDCDWRLMEYGHKDDLCVQALTHSLRQFRPASLINCKTALSSLFQDISSWYRQPLALKLSWTPDLFTLHKGPNFKLWLLHVLL